MSILVFIFLFQLNLRWRPDLISLILGSVIGGLLLFGLQKLLPVLFRWQQQVRGRVQETQQWMRSGVDSRHRADVATYVEKYHPANQPHPLPHLFVPPNLLAPSSLLDLTELRSNGPEQLIYLWPLLAGRVAMPALPLISLGQLLRNGRRVALIGEPGAGKTTLLAYAAYLTATVNEEHPLAFLQQRVPVWVHLVELDLNAAATDPLLPILQAMQARASVLTKTGLDGFLREAAQSGQMMLLLDGWDEYATTQRTAVTEWLSQLLTAYPEIQLIAAAPLRGYGPLTELGLLPTMLLPWRVGQATAYDKQWHHNHPQRKTGVLTNYWRSGQSALETALRHQVSLHQKEKPTNSSELFRQAIAAATNSKTPTWLPPFAMQIWQIMAFRLLEQDKFALTTAEVAALVTEIAITSQINERNLLNQWQAYSLHCGILQQWTDTRLSFRNPLWRDFCAAAYLSQADNTTLLKEKLDDPDWREVIRFYVGQKGGQQLAPALLEHRDKAPWLDSLFQLASWLPEVTNSEEWQRQLLVQLGKMVLQIELPVVLRLRAMATMALTRDAATRVFWQQLLQRSDPLLREMAVLCLPLLGAERVLDLWQKMLQDQTVEVRRAVIWAMAWSGEIVAEKPLLLALVGTDEHVSQAVAEALARNGGESWDVLKEALQESDLAVRRAAIWGLSQIDEPWVPELFAKVELNDKEWIVRTAAKEARQELLAQQEYQPWQPLNPHDMVWFAQWLLQPRKNASADTSPVALLLEALHQAEKPAVRAAAAQTLGHMAVKEAVGPLQQALRDPKTEVVEAAFAALGQIRRVYGGSEQ